MHTISLLFHDVHGGDPSRSGFTGVVANRYKIAVDDFDAVLRELADCDHVRVTVDDGGASYYEMIADRLEQRGWRGYCFMPTDMIGTPGFLSRRQLRELDARGHILGSHSASHPTRFSACSFDAMVREWTESRAVLEDLLGHRVEVASLPGGYYSAAVARSADTAGLRRLFTSEPCARAWHQGACEVVGRYTVRPSHSPESVRALVTGVPFARWREWAVWNAKKTVKPLLGPMYPRLGAWLGSNPTV